MIQALHEARDSFRASPIFTFYVLATLVIAGVVGLMTFRSDLFPGLRGMDHFGDLSHRTHDLIYGSLFTTSVVGLLAQLRRPVSNVAGMGMALIPGAALGIAALLASDSNVVRGNPLRWAVMVTAIVALLHPTGRGFLRSFSVKRINPVMLGLVTVAALPLLGLASTNIERQTPPVTDAHAAMGHYGFMAAFSFTTIGVGLLASLRPDGWRLTAWVAGALPAMLGVTSLLYPDASSSLGLSWALAAMAWGAVFVAMAELTRDVEHPTPLGIRALKPTSSHS